MGEFSWVGRGCSRLSKSLVLKRRVLPDPPGIPHLNLDSLAALGSPGLRVDSAFTSTSRTLICWLSRQTGAQVGGSRKMVFR